MPSKPSKKVVGMIIRRKTIIKDGVVTVSFSRDGNSRFVCDTVRDVDLDGLFK